MIRRWILAASLLVSPVFAEEAIRGVEDVATIDDGEGHGRVLFRCDDLVPMENVRIWKAMLRFDVQGAPEERVLPLVIHPITRPWDAGSVDWESGWMRPGGDYDETLFARAELQLGRGSGRYSIDVTTLAKEIVESGYTCHGFLATVDRSEGIGFVEADLVRMEGLGSGNVEVHYRTTPPVPRAIARGE